MSDLTEFLLARIADDERQVSGPNATKSAAARWLTGRVLAECAAKRTIVRREDPGSLRALAGIYADHPDHRDEWSSS